MIDDFMAMMGIFSDYMASAADESRYVMLFTNTTVDQMICAEFFMNGIPWVVPLYTIPISIRNAVLRFIMTMRSISAFAAKQHVSGWMTGLEMCQFVQLVATMPSGVQLAYALTLEQFTEQTESDQDLVLTWLIISLVVMLVVVIPFINAIVVFYALGYSNIVNAIRSLPSSAALEASKPVCKLGESDQAGRASADAKQSSTGTFLLLGHIIAGLIMIIGFIVFSILMLAHTSSSEESLRWLMEGARRRSLGLQVLTQYTMALIVPDLYYDSTAGWGLAGSGIFAEVELANALARFEEFARVSIDLYDGSDEVESIKDHFPELDDLQLRDMCEPGVTTTRHDVYHCFALRALTNFMSTLIEQVQLVPDPATGGWVSRSDIKDSILIDLSHLVLTELAAKLKRANEIVREDMDSLNSVMNAVVIVIVILIIAAFLFHLWLLTLTIRRSQRLSKAGMVLLRRVPPPALVNSAEITRLLLGQVEIEQETADSASAVAFEHIPRAALIISVDETIEDINARAREIFALARRQVIGQKLMALIAKPEGEADDLSDLDLGGRAVFESLDRMRKPECQNWHSTANANCTRSDDSLCACRVDVEGIPDLAGNVGGFLIFLTESAEEQRVAIQLRDAREHVMRLQNQLVPNDVQGFIRDGRTDFAFQTKTVSVVAVQIATFGAHLRQAGTLPFLERLHRFWGRLGVLCAQHPPLVRQAELTDTFIAVAGLFSADDPQTYATAALGFATDVLEDVQASEAELRVLISITVGGPLLCGLTGSTEEHTFVAFGAAIEEAVALTELSAPNKILISGPTKDLLPEVEFEPGGDAARGYFVRFSPGELQRKHSETAVPLAGQIPLSMADDDSQLDLPEINE
jgi:PAS domain-containing protein